MLLIDCVICCSFLFMNDRVYKLQMQINEGCYNYLIKYLSQFKNDEEFLLHEKEYYELKERVLKINDKYSYSRQLFSFRKPTLESWFKDEELEIIKQGLTYKIT